jgi:hypothetical protein
MDGIEQILIPEWFGQKFHRAVFHGPNRHRNISVSRDEDDRDGVFGSGHLPLKI